MSGDSQIVAAAAPDDTRVMLAALCQPFRHGELEWRIQQAGLKKPDRQDDPPIPWAKVVAYVQSRAIMSRLDEVVGPANWRDEYREWTIDGKAGVLCGLSIRVNGEWITKWDGAEPSDIEPIKGGLSAALKRAAVKWGIGRYLYGLDEGWARAVKKNTPGSESSCIKPKQGGWYREDYWFSWLPPELPHWATHEDDRRSPRGNRAEPQPEPRQVQRQEQRSAPVATAPAQKPQPPVEVTVGTGQSPVPVEPASGHATGHAAETTAVSHDPLQETRKILAACGARSPDDADVICRYVTFANGLIKYADAKAKAQAGDTGPITIVWMKLRAATGTDEARAAILPRARAWAAQA